jgi:ABC-type polysaccharide/polyol phosphate transport system ATPase subunit
MKSDVAVHVTNISKTYRLYRKPVYRLLEALTRRSYHQGITSLRPLSLMLPPGDTLGIIGENGAGKSTLLKILAGTLTPTTGQVHMKGRVAALLELGSGFHPEFTGRQNIYLNASLHGLDKTEIKNQEQSIIDFAELGDFIDRPIKTYSSGMTVRLGFSIATSIDPDVLIVDEALSVGDQHFQKKCIERMNGFRKAGKTLILCSHSMYMINQLCRNAIWLNQGMLEKHDSAAHVISAYMAAQEARHKNVSTQDNAMVSTQVNMPEVTVESVDIFNQDSCMVEQVRQFDTMIIRIKLKRHVSKGFSGHVALVLEDEKKSVLFATLSRDQYGKPITFKKEQILTLELPSLPIQKGVYCARVLVSDDNALRLIHQNVSNPCLVHSEHPEYGILWMPHHWKI